MSEKFIAIQLVARLDTVMSEECDALRERILQAFGCDDNEANCPMVLFASTVVNDAETACNWLQ